MQTSGRQTHGIRLTKQCMPEYETDRDDGAVVFIVVRSVCYRWRPGGRPILGSLSSSVIGERSKYGDRSEDHAILSRHRSYIMQVHSRRPTTRPDQTRRDACRLSGLVTDTLMVSAKLLNVIDGGARMRVCKCGRVGDVARAVRRRRTGSRITASTAMSLNTSD